MLPGFLIKMASVTNCSVSGQFLPGILNMAAKIPQPIRLKNQTLKGPAMEGPNNLLQDVQ